MADSKDYLLTTVDNPYNPHTSWDQWYDYDERTAIVTGKQIGRAHV